MQFELTADGCGAVCLGMARQAAGLALESWGECTPFRRGFGNEGWAVTRGTMMMFAYVDDIDRVNGIEFASPGRGVPADDHVVFDGVDLFADEADIVIANLKGRGWGVIESDDREEVTIPDVLLALWRFGEPEDESTGLPLYFESALIARPGYYD